MKKRWIAFKAAICEFVFRWDNAKRGRRHIDALVEMAHADGHLAESEKQLIRQMQGLYGVKCPQTPREQPAEGKLQPSYFRQASDRANAFYEIVLMMASDGVHAPEEYECGKKYAEILGYDEEDTQLLLDALNGELLEPEADE